MQWTTEVHKIKQLVTGDYLTIRTHTLKGDEEGPHIHIQASVHGAEIQGNAVILQLMQVLNQQKVKGSITFIPLCNPFATATKNGTYTYGRFNPVTGHNWNRNFIDIIDKESHGSLTLFCQNHLNSSWDEIKNDFKIYLSNLYSQMQNRLIEQGRYHDNVKFNLIVQQIASKADGILDLHTGPTATRYLYTAEYQKNIAKHLLFNHILVIPNEFAGAMDESCFIPWIHLKNEFLKLGRDISLDVESFTLEFGSEETFSMDWAEKDIKSILNYLAYKKVIEKNVDANKPNLCLLKDYKTLYAPHGGLADFRFSPGDHFKKGDVLASFYCFDQLDPNHPVASTKKDVVATEDGIIINRCPSSAVTQGMELYQIMTNIYSEN